MSRIATPPHETKLDIRSKRLQDYEFPHNLKNARTYFPKSGVPCIAFVERETLRKIINHKDVVAFCIVPCLVLRGMTLYAVGFNNTEPTVSRYDVKYFIKKYEKTVDKELELC